MSFLVYEQDPFVCVDICEALLAEFPRADISVAQSLDALKRKLEEGGERLTVILALSAEDCAAAREVVSSFSNSAKWVIVGNEAPSGFDLATKLPFVQKPFSSQGLISAIRGGFAGRHACQ
tara:strand:- start:15 stop:377 length:363 start_codon:yes stop_codon:yes gene_type:complete